MQKNSPPDNSTHDLGIMSELDETPMVVKKTTDDGWTIVVSNAGGVLTQDKFFVGELDAMPTLIDAYLQEQQDLIGKRGGR